MQYLKSTKLAFILGALFMSLPAALPIPAQAEENIWQDEGEFSDEEADEHEVLNDEPAFSPYRVLGRGLVDRRTEEVLQIACVGPESSCELIQFLRTDTSGVQTLHGPIMEISDDDGITRSEILKTLREHELAAPVVAGNRIFQVSQAIYLGKSTHAISNHAGPATPVVAVTALYGIGRALPAIWFNNGIAIAGAAGFAWVLPFVGVPLILDLAFLPFQITKMNREFGALFGGFGKNVTLKMMQDRSANAWQLKPRRVSHRGFERFMNALAGAR